MATFLLVGLVTMLPLLEEEAAHAAPSKAKVFLAAAQDARVEKECHAQVASALTARIADAKRIVPARSAADADVVVQVRECRTVTASQVGVGGEIGASVPLSGRQGRDVRAGYSVGVQQTRVGRVVLVVDDQGKPREFASAAGEQPLDEAARSATESFLAWVKARYTR